MPARVQIVVEASDATGGVLRAISNQFGALGGLVEELSAKSVSWGNVAERATTLVINGLKDAVQSTMRYAEQVRDLSAISGQSTEDTSRFLQVLDDYQLGMEDATTATRTLTKQGLAPNIDTLAKLSDEYRALNSVEAKNELILKNLGRSGLGWVNALNQGGEALRAQAAAVEAGLILSRRQADEAEKLRLNLDKLNDSWTAGKIALGNDLIPVLNAGIEGMDDMARAIQIVTEAGGNWVYSTNAVKQAAIAQAASEREAAAATKERRAEVEKAIKADEEAAKAIDAHNKAFVGMVNSFASTEESYVKTAQKLHDERMQLEDEKQQKLAQGYSEEGQDIQEINKKLAENGAAATAAANEHDLANKRIILGYLEQKLAADGLTDRELEALLETGKAWGVYSQTVVDQTRSAMRTIDQYLEGLNSIPRNITTQLSVQGAAFAGNAPGRSYYSGTKRQHGGQVIGGHGYMVGEAGPEPFFPDRSGMIIPNNKIGGNVTVIVDFRPMISTADSADLKSRLLPLIVQGVQEAKVQGKI